MRIPDHLPHDIPPQMLASHASDDMLLFTAALSIVIGAILIWLGRQGRQQWMVVWSIGLIICAVGMAAAVVDI